MANIFQASDSYYASRKGRGSYANPHHTIAQRDTPVHLRHVIQLCMYYYATDSLLGACIEKMAEYPITDLIIEGIGDCDEEVIKKWEKLLNKQMRLKACLRSMNAMKSVAGKSAWFLNLPFARVAVARSDGAKFPLRMLDGPKVRVVDEPRSKEDFQILVEARRPGGDRTEEFVIKDYKSKDRSKIRLVQQDPLSLKLDYDPSSGNRIWYWRPQSRLREALVNGNMAVLEGASMSALKAAWRDWVVRVNPNRMFISQTDEIPGIWPGHGFPPLFRVLEDTYYYKLLRRANEALAEEHILPMRVISPSSSGDVTPSQHLPIVQWQNSFRGEVRKFRRDPNHLILSPTSVNVENVGGQARVLMVAAEMEAAARWVTTGLGLPLEMLWGGLNWSGGNISLRILENHMLNSRASSQDFIDFLIPQLSAACGLPLVKVSLSDFKMADDAQQLANVINLMLQGHIDAETVLTEMGYDSEQIKSRLVEQHEWMNTITMNDQIAAAYMGTVVQRINQQAQVLLNYEMQLMDESMQARTTRQKLENLADYVKKLRDKGIATPLELEQTAQLIAKIPPEMQQSILRNWSSTMPMVTRMIIEKAGVAPLSVPQQAGPMPSQVNPGGGGEQAAGNPEFGNPEFGNPGNFSEEEGVSDTEVDMTGMPEQLPPRRDQSPI